MKQKALVSIVCGIEKNPLQMHKILANAEALKNLFYHLYKTKQNWVNSQEM